VNALTHPLPDVASEPAKSWWMWSISDVTLLMYEAIPAMQRAFVRRFGEVGAFTYPPSVLVAGLVTPLLLLWMFALLVNGSLMASSSLSDSKE